MIALIAAHLAGRRNHQQLTRLWQWRRESIFTQQRRDLGLDHFHRTLAQGEHHFDQFELSVLIQVSQLDARNQSLRNPLSQVRADQHSIAPNQAESACRQHSVQQIERLGRRIGLRVAVGKRALRQFVDHQRQICLPSEPIQHIQPLLLAEGKLQLGRFRLGRVGCVGAFGCVRAVAWVGGVAGRCFDCPSGGRRLGLLGEGRDFRQQGQRNAAEDKPRLSSGTSRGHPSWTPGR